MISIFIDKIYENERNQNEKYRPNILANRFMLFNANFSKISPSIDL